MTETITAAAIRVGGASLPYIYRWDRQGRKGQRCNVIVRGRTMNSCLVLFEDGYTMVTSRNAIRKAPREEHAVLTITNNPEA